MSDAAQRAAEVAESACGGQCSVCADYIATGNPDLRPATREEYEARIRKDGAR